MSFKKEQQQRNNKETKKDKKFQRCDLVEPSFFMSPSREQTSLHITQHSTFQPFKMSKKGVGPKK